MKSWFNIVLKLMIFPTIFGGNYTVDKLETYRQIIIAIISKHAEYKPSHGKIEPLSICDQNSDNYLLMDTGWDQTGRVHAVVFHLRIIDNKICIEWDGTERGITG